MAKRKGEETVSPWFTQLEAHSPGSTAVEAAAHAVALALDLGRDRRPGQSPEIGVLLSLHHQNLIYDEIDIKRTAIIRN
ncbi:uncharacterized protein SPSK_02856 [Sporothrix schenckii 1099-18]|uniref:Uncharacterized protein n=1 Tax=Sporothrix schenckii 1099-18 TaxID=1397361 RepID=A0A0F2MA41_SPOSC|nr:uncharacterized protein SPSK_02856 [Sporothrix schenckii 1099-18]KJR86507.1 hypothetical protein SPSK_02856 [Sporothrix schenckii 1099-18]